MRKLMLLILFILLLGCKEKSIRESEIESLNADSLINEIETEEPFVFHEENEPLQNERIEPVQVSEADFIIDEAGVITGYNGPENVALVIPATIDGLAVTAISARVFSTVGLTSLIMPNTILSIGNAAFDNNTLISVTLSNSLTSIGNVAFALNRLSSIIIPESVTFIDSGAFLNNLLTSVAIPDSVTDTGMGVFSSNQLKAVTISRSMPYIREALFAGNQLTSVTLPNNIVYIGIDAFANNKLALVVIPDSVTRIDRNAFAKNELTSIVIPDSVTSINGGAFNNNQLARITIGAGVSTGSNMTELGGPPSDDETALVTPFRDGWYEYHYFVPAFDNDFDAFYEANSRQAGTYVFYNGEWNIE